MKRTVVISLFIAFTSISCSQDDGENGSTPDADVDAGSLADSSTDASDSDGSSDTRAEVDMVPDMSCETTSESEKINADPQNLMTCDAFCEGLGLFCDPTAPPLSFKKGGVAKYENGVSSLFGCDVVPEATDGDAAIERFACYCTCAEQP